MSVPSVHDQQPSVQLPSVSRVDSEVGRVKGRTKRQNWPEPNTRFSLFISLV